MSKLDLLQGNPVESYSDFSSDKVRISTENLGLMFSTISEGLYSNPIGSIIREIVSNAYDATIEAGSDEPVIVSFSIDEGGNYISIKDFGVGLSPERVKTVFLELFSSTKRNDDRQIGAFGIGRFSVFSYTNNYYVISNYNGKKTTYHLYQSNDLPEFSILTEEDTNEPNGTTVKFYIKQQEDYLSFIDEYNKQLKFFPNVVLDVHPDLLNVKKEINWYNKKYLKDEISNDKKIVQYNTFIVSNEKCNSNELSICLGYVNYPLDTSLIRKPIFETNSSFALRFKNGELPVTRSRENIKYTPEAIAKINERIEEFKDEISLLYEQQKFDFDSLSSLMSESTLRTNEKTLILEKEQSIIPDWVERKKFHIANNPYLTKDVLLSSTFIGYQITHKIMSKTVESYNSFTAFLLRNNKGKYFRKSTNRVPKKDKYIYSTRGECYIIERTKPSLKQYKGVLDLKKHDVANWRSKIKTYQKIVEDYIIESTEKYEDLIVPKEVVEKTKASIFRSNHEIINVRAVNPLSTWKSRVDSMKIKVSDLNKDINELRKYTKKDPNYNLHKRVIIGTDKNIFNHFSFCRIGIGYVGKTLIKHLEGHPSIMFFDKIKEMEYREIKRATIAYYLEKKSQILKESSDWLKFLSIIRPDYYKNLQEINEYINVNKLHHINDLFWEELTTIAEEKGLFEHDTHIQNLEELLKFKQQTTFFNYVSIKNMFSPVMSHVIEYMKDKKYKMHYMFYNGVYEEVVRIYNYYCGVYETKSGYDEKNAVVKEFYGRLGIDNTNSGLMIDVDLLRRNLFNNYETIKSHLKNFKHVPLESENTATDEHMMDHYEEIVEIEETK